MSEYCDIFPEDPTCAVEEEEVVVEEEEVVIEDEETADAEGDNEEADAEEMDGEMMEEMEEEMMEKMDKMDWDMTPSQMWMKAGHLMKFASIDPFMGEITFALVAIGVTTDTALELFRYRDSDAYKAYITGDKADSTNFFKLGDLISKYTNLAVFGIAAVTQILAGLGIAPGINMLVWGWGVMFIGGIASFIGNLLKFWAYETGYSNIKELNNASAMALIKHAMVEDTIMEASVGLSLYMSAENWMWAQWDRATQEEKETKLEELMAEIEEWDAEKMAEMEGEMKEEMSDDEDEDVEEDVEEDAEEADEEEAEEDAEEEE